VHFHLSAFKVPGKGGHQQSPTVPGNGTTLGWASQEGNSALGEKLNGEGFPHDWDYRQGGDWATAVQTGQRGTISKRDPVPGSTTEGGYTRQTQGG